MQGIKHNLVVIGLFCLALIVLLLIWEEIVLSNVINNLFLATPVQVAQNFVSVLSEPQVYVRLEETLRLAFLAFAFAIVIGSGIGLLIGGIRILKAAFEPYVILANSVPRAIFVPLFWAYFGFGDNYRFFFGFVSSIIPVVINVMYAVRAVDPQLFKVATSFGASKRQAYTKVVVPTIIPAVLGAARLSFNLAFGGVIIAEEFVGSFGAGFLAVSYASAFDTYSTISLYSIVVAIALIAVTVNVGLLLIEKWYLRWNRS